MEIVKAGVVKPLVYAGVGAHMIKHRILYFSGYCVINLFFLLVWEMFQFKTQLIYIFIPLSTDMNNLLEIKKVQRETERKIKILTKGDFGSQLYYIEKQNNLLFEFLANFYSSKNLYPVNHEQFILCLALLDDMLRKQKICRNLVSKGFYDEAAELVRHMLQSCFTIIYLKQNKDSWRDWFMQQGYEEDKLTKSVKTPHTIFSKFKDLLKLINEKHYYLIFQKLCSWSHPSIEVMRSSMQLSSENGNRYYFTRRYNKEKTEFLLNMLYGLINIAFWDGFKDVFIINSEIPHILVSYKNMQNKATLKFNIFYET